MLKDIWKPLIMKPRFCALTPFPRWTWIHSNTPKDDFDQVCQIIWSRTTHLTGRGHGSPHRPGDAGEVLSEYQSNGSVERQQNSKYSVLGHQHVKDKRQHHTEFNLPCPYVSGCRHLTVVEPAQVKCAKDKLKSGRNPVKKLWVPPTSNEQKKYTQYHSKPFPSKQNQDLCKSEQEANILFDPNSGKVTLLGVQIDASDSSKTVSEIGIYDGDKTGSPNIPERSGSDMEQGFLFDTETEFPQLLPNKAGIPPCPTESSNSRKVHSQWDIPFSFHAPSATLASGVSAPLPAPIQSKELHANSTTDKSPVQQRAYDLLADFPALQPPEIPLSLGEVGHGNPRTRTTEAKRGLTLSPNQCQDSVVSHKRRVEKVPHEFSSICSGDQKSALGLETFGLDSQSNSHSVSCEEVKADNRLATTVAGTDGEGAAKAGMREAADPREKAKPCTFQHTVANNRPKGQRYPI